MPEKNARALCIKDDLTVINVGRLKDEFFSTLGECEKLEMNLSAVNEFDSSGLQLLIVLSREAQARGKEFTITAFSPAVVSVLKLFNLEEYFNVRDEALAIRPDDDEDFTGQ